MNVKNNRVSHRLPATIALTAFFFMLTAFIPSSAPPVSFTFTLSTASKTSAGVYTADSTLIKTLWSGVTYAAGTHTATWDGTTDDGVLAPDGNYQVRVLANNVNYLWESVLGNNSDSLTGPSVHRGYSAINGMAVAGNYIYYSKNYSEGSPAQQKCSLANPRIRIPISRISGTTGQKTDFVAADTAAAYWAGNDPANAGKYFVFATRASDDAQKIFSAGSLLQTKWGFTYTSAIDTLTNANGAITGLAVQKSGSYLFIAHAGLNEIHVLNKSNGTLIQTLSYTAPKYLAVDDSSNMWMMHTVSGTATVEKFHININGTLSTTGITLTGLNVPLAMAISKDNQLVVVADGGTSQQLKAYSSITGTASWVYGQAGGYANGPAVSDDKFYFSDQRETMATFIAFQDDGSFWVGDPGNSRAQHYDASRTFIDRIIYIPHFYSCFVDANNPTRVFGDYCEYQVDYSKPLGHNNGSWSLVKNWGYNVPAAYDDKFGRMRSVATLSNGRTYMLLLNPTTGMYQVAELPASGNLRLTGVLIARNHNQLYPDGSFRRVTRTFLGQSNSWYTKPLTGFDASNNPVWGAETLVATSPVNNGKDPGYFGNYNKLRSGEITSSGILLSFDGAEAHPGFDNYHLGGIKPGSNKWLWRTAPSTPAGYIGPFPPDGTYDIANGVQYAGVSAMAAGRNVFWGYHGEFWKGSQTNKWNHVYDNGLFIGQFGITGPEVAGQEAAAEMAGNGFSANVVKMGDTVYIYHNEEGFYSSGIHRWRITGLNTILELKDTVTLSTTGHGLVASYFNGRDLNNMNHTISRIDSTVHVNLAATGVSDTAVFSASWTGYVQPLYSEKYRFYTNTTEGVRLWINGKLITDHPDTTGAAEYSDTLALTAGMRYPVRMEIFESTGPATASLSWSSTSQPKAQIPFTQLTPAEMPDYTAGYDLLENLPYETVLKNNLYGWTRSPIADDYTNTQEQYWKVRTNVKGYERSKSPDLYIKYRQVSSTATAHVSRDLGTVSNTTTSWQLVGKLNYENNAINEDTVKAGQTGSGGSFLEVADDQGKIIIRLYWYVNTVTKATRLYANQKIVVSGLQNALVPVYSATQPISILINNDSITVQYGTYPAVTTIKSDTAAHLYKPKTLRYYCWTKSRNYDRVIDIISMKFSAVSGGARMISNSRDGISQLTDTLTAPVFRVYPNPLYGNEFTIRLMNTSLPELQITVTDISGKTVFNKNIITAKDGYYHVPLTRKLAPGTYVVTANGRYSQQLVIY